MQFILLVHNVYQCTLMLVLYDFRSAFNVHRAIYYSSNGNFNIYLQKV